MQTHPHLVDDDQDRVHNFQVCILQHVVGDLLPVVGNPPHLVGDPLCVVGVWCLRKVIAWLNEALSHIMFTTYIHLQNKRQA